MGLRRAVETNDIRRKLKAIVFAASAGAGMLALAQYVLFPAVAARLTKSQVIWLRNVFRTHFGLVLLAIAIIAAVLALPVLLVALWAGRMGPWQVKPGSEG